MRCLSITQGKESRCWSMLSQSSSNPKRTKMNNSWELLKKNSGNNTKNWWLKNMPSRSSKRNSLFKQYWTTTTWSPNSINLRRRSTCRNKNSKMNWKQPKTNLRRSWNKKRYKRQKSLRSLRRSSPNNSWCNKTNKSIGLSRRSRQGLRLKANR